MSTCPSGKLTYPSAQAAARAALAVRSGKTHSRAAQASWNHCQLKHYHCPMCREWHIGHANPQGKRA